MTAGYTLTENASLAQRNTLRVDADAAWFAEVADPDTLPALLSSPHARGEVLVLGDGSNVLFTRDFPGLVIHIAHDAVERIGNGHIRVGAGADWHRFVRWSLEQGYTGLENLALIPGTVGAAPVQNIGAYGTELAEFIHAVRAWDRETNEWSVLDGDDCGFGYRDSVFKRLPDRFVVAAVEFRLARDRPLTLDYAGVRDELAAMGIDAPTATDVADAVERIRRRKLPDPAEIGNAGSFFKNPIVSRVRANTLQSMHAELPAWPAGEGLMKLSAAWLIERCGFKGKREGDAGIAPGHALVLVNHGNASGLDLWQLAVRIQTVVYAEFGVRLEPEPRVI